MLELSDGSYAPLNRVRCRCAMTFHDIDDKELTGPVYRARQEYFCDPAALRDAAFDMRIEVEASLASRLVNEGIRLHRWPSAPPEFKWEVWDGEAIRLHGEPGAFVAYTWPHKKEEHNG